MYDKSNVQLNNIQLKHGIQPFWFWNGEMKDDEIKRQIHLMKEQGLTGFLIHPRQGMEIPYLSEVYFEKVRLAVMTAKELNMEVWLYDEFPYPSGISGGKVTLNKPEYTCKRLMETSGTYEGGQTAKLYASWGKVLMARAYRIQDGKCCYDDYIDLEKYVGCGYQQDVFQMSGLTKYNKKRYFQGELSQYLYWEVPEGNWKVYLYTEVEMKHFKYFENFIDPLNPEAVRCFLETTHEQYKKHIGDEFGKTIKGVFTDEVTAFPPSQPWSPLLPGLVKERYGIDLLDYLPALTEDMGAITKKIRYAYWDTVTEQFIKSWDKQVYQWCEDNNLQYIGEKPILRSKQLEYVHVPGIDAGHQKFGSEALLIGPRYRSNGKIVSSAAHFYKKPATLCEAFHSIGWGMTIQDAKWIFDWLTVQGIDWFVTHGSYYTTDALKKHDAPPSSFYQMPWWQDMHQLTEYVYKLNHFLMDGKRQVSVLLLDPITSTWTENKAEKKQLDTVFGDFQNDLLKAGVDFYIMDPQLFAKGKAVKKDEKAYYEYADDNYNIVVLPYMTNLEQEAVDKLREFVDACGKVVTVGSIPYWNMNNEDFGDWTRNNTTFIQESKDAARFLRDQVKIDQKYIISGDDKVLSVQRTDGLLFIVNTDAKDHEITIECEGKNVLRKLSGGESIFLDEQSFARETKPAARTITIDTNEVLPFTTKSLNALRIGNFHMTMQDGQTAEADSFPFIDQMEDANIKIPIQQKKYFGCPKELEFPETEAEYTYTFCNHIKDRTEHIYLVMEPGTLLGDWSLSINDKQYQEADFNNKTFYLNTNLAIDVTEALCVGENILKLKIHSDKSFGGIRNPLYLFGKFAVDLSEKRPIIEEQKSTGCINDLTGDGLAYFAGTVEFSKPVRQEWFQDLKAEDEIEFVIEDSRFHDALRFRVDDVELDTGAWAPRRYCVSCSKLMKAKTITLSLDTSMSRLFEGEYFDEEQHSYKTVK